MTRVGDVKEKDAVLPAQQAKQAAAGQNVVVGRKMAVVRLIAYVARRRNGNGSDYLSIVVGIFVKVNDGKKVGATRA